MNAKTGAEGGSTRSQPPPRAEGDELSTRVELAPGVTVARKSLEFEFARASGPGGQNVNKVSTAARLRVDLSAISGLSYGALARLRALAGGRLGRDGAIVFRARAERSQLANRRACIERLSALVAAALVEPIVRKKKKPTRGMIERRLESKKHRSETKRRRRVDEG